MKSANSPKPEPARYVFVEAPRCPNCESTRLKIVRSVRNGRVGRLKWAWCRDCPWRFKIVVE
jgi:hypothetical protein